ncbi:MAG: hypothetical protein ABC579_03280 [Candidatus Methanosuratincola petrocarbonis]
MSALADEIEIAMDSGLLPRDYLADFARKNKVDLVIPLAVSLSTYNELLDLSVTYCVRCGKVHRSGGRADERCSSCRAPLICAPIWYISSDRNKKTLYTSSNQRLNQSLNSRSVKNRMGISSDIKEIRITDYSRPTVSLHAKTDGGLKRISPVVREGYYEFKIGNPSEEGTKPITFTVFDSEQSDSRELDPKAFPGIKGLKYCKGITVLQATVGYRAGNPTGKKSEKVFVFDYKDGRYTLFCRLLKTDGLVIEVDDSAIKDNNLSKWQAYHTISHAFLTPAPMVSGLDSYSFAEAIMASKGRVAVFDNVEGGVGGISGIFSDTHSTDEYFYYVRQKVLCQNECFSSCKACLFTDSCYMLNFNLNRHVLQKLGW